MKVKEIIKLYPNYQIIGKGYPTSQPFAQLPKELNGLYGREYEKVFNELEVKGYEVKENPHTCIDITHCVFGGAKRRNRSYRGTVVLYLVSSEPYRRTTHALKQEKL